MKRLEEEKKISDLIEAGMISEESWIDHNWIWTTTKLQIGVFGQLVVTLNHGDQERSLVCVCLVNWTF